MTTLYISHPSCHLHEPNDGHPECPARLEAIENILNKVTLEHRLANSATRDDLILAHDVRYVDSVFKNIPNIGLNFLDPDTAVCSQSGDAALHAVGAVIDAVDAVMNNEVQNAFCAVRPPGHHAHRDHAAGFCLFNNTVIGALTALQKHGLKRVAILDFDVHHGDGTQDIVQDNPGIFFASTYQHPLYASRSQTPDDTGGHNNIMKHEFPTGTLGHQIVDVWKEVILPNVEAFKPEMILVSAGFDGHRDDPLAGLEFTEKDYADLMYTIKHLATRICKGRLVVVLEGGYNLQALSKSVLACLKVLGE